MYFDKGGVRVGLIDEIIRIAVDRNSSVADLLRMALVASSKLKTTHMREWLEHELNGYPSYDDVPDYRRLKGTVKVKNPYRGWQVLYGIPDSIDEVVSVRATPEGVAEVASWIEDGNSVIGFSLGNFSEILMEHLPFKMESCLHVPRGSLVAVLDRVRSSILQWALELQENNVVGEDFSFTPTERAAANSVNITNHIGSINNSQLQQGSTGDLTMNSTVDLAALIELLKELKSDPSGIESDSVPELVAEIDTVIAQSQSPKPKSSILRESLASVRKIAESATGGVVAANVNAKLPALLHALGLN
ncbi:hypothetical protein Q6A26_21840 [Xanthomonas euvesicatoria pv. eucalypti]|uniref:AbiTii domain-containing protein n=1 Tax=Xanthomonas euvesicatoria TaxID=456327 RepID=UPI0026E24DD6|nr:hypothetical protein [Xanthomonas euvesicatoria]MDO7934625.1 hypothetical protein [Xanthomonas euvesicatoria pv. eucalypti]MDO7938795.1 hypothetical protein [Xanthomonas euvesicatoria pv. eucalypti]MDO7943008.1 hypothetical protein [Xanthomonas euvesicatoria pv. eucalypti]MDO7947200.1 hypothetical protein [Xanthomonas euvesicatoria pv. eucalypti]MDO7950491.1 hypothetical protein [Xanthomonas euvesicatoria pv. eucalypti]